MLVLFTLLTVVLVALTVTVLMCNFWGNGLPIAAAMSVRPVRATGGRAEADIQPAVKAVIYNQTDSELSQMALRGAVAELLRVGRLFRTCLEIYAASLRHRHLVSARDVEVIKAYGRGIDLALDDYNDSVIQSLQGVTRYLHDMVVLALIFNVRARKGSSDGVCQQLTQELRERRDYPWGLYVPRIESALDMSDRVSVACESLGFAPVWLNRICEAGTESAYTRLMTALAKLRSIEKSLNPTI